MTSVKFTYLYRDGSNYKRWGEVLFAATGHESLSEIEKILRSQLFDEELFIAEQIAIPNLFLWAGSRPDLDDHCFHEFDSLDWADATPTDSQSRTIGEFLDDLRRVSNVGWRCFDPAERSGS